MGNFITYGVTETLDNDQKFIIDSDRTGPGSITAKDAASSLLSKWAGFETFEEAVQNTISNNQEFIDRDAAIRSETAELKKKIVTTFPAKDASGAVATFESEFEDAPLKSCIVHVEPVQDLHGYDSPWPAGGGDCVLRQYEEAPVIPGLTISVSGGKITVSGTVESTTTIDAPVTNWQWDGVSDYWLSGCPAGGNSTKGYSLRVDGTNGKYSDYDIGNGIRLIPYFSDLSGTNLKFRIVLRPGTYSNLTFAPMLNAGLSAAPYSPYSNECPITGWTGCEVQRTGKNLFGGEAFRDAVLAAVATATTGEDENGRYVTITAGSASHEKVLFEYPWKENTVYTFIYRYKKNNTNGVTNLSLHYKDGTYNYLARSGGVEADTVYTEVLKSVKYKLPSDIRAIWGSGTATIYYDDFGIFEGDISVDYFVPYTGQTYPITFPTEAGTVYGGYIDPINGDIVADRCFLEGINWTEYKRNNGFVAYRAENVPSAYSNNWTSKPISNIISNFGNFNSDKMTQNIVQIVGFSTVVYMALSEEVDASQVQLSYKLAEPIHYPLTPTEIKTLLGTNNIWSNTGDTAVEYLMSDVSWYVEKKLRAFQSVLAGVEDSAVASKNYSTNTYLIFNDDIYRVTKAITAGETIEEGVNVTKTTVAEQLMALAQA